MLLAAVIVAALVVGLVVGYMLGSRRAIARISEALRTDRAVATAMLEDLVKRWGGRLELYQQPTQAPPGIDGPAAR